MVLLFAAFKAIIFGTHLTDIEGDPALDLFVNFSTFQVCENNKKKSPATNYREKYERCLKQILSSY